jgi:rhodanese-related sulfurtransferase
MLGALSVAACSQPASNKEMVTLDQARAEHDAGKVVLIDIREPVEHAERVAQGAKRGWPMVKPQ